MTKSLPAASTPANPIAAAPVRRTPAWARPDTASGMALVFVVFASVWLIYLNEVSLAPPIDDIEQLNWVRSLQWGYYKHPPLPTWLLWLPTKAFGLSATAAYVMGALCTLASIALMGRLLVTLRGPTYAAVAVLAALCITYYNFRLYYYNHNVVLMLLSSASACLCWQAFATRRLRWWLALGLAIGLGALAKYQVAVTVVCVLVFALHQRAWREPVHRRGAMLAALVAAVVFAPHALWLVRHDFAPLHYAVETSLGAQFGLGTRFTNSAHWLIDQLFNRALPALVLLVLAARPWRSTGTAARTHAASEGDAARALLLSWGLIPLLLMPGVGLLFGADLQLHWGTAFICFAVPAAMECWRGVHWRAIDAQRVLRAFCVVQAVLLLAALATSPSGVLAWNRHHWHSFNAREFAHRIAAPARAALGESIRVISGPPAVAGALSLQLPERPLVLIDGRTDRSPWVPSDLVRRCGVLRVGPADSLVGGQRLGNSLDRWAWQAVPRDPAAAPCPALP